jgi:hypothetical protein
VFTKTSRLILLGHKLLTILDKNEWNWARKQKEKDSNIEGRRQSDFLEKNYKVTLPTPPLFLFFLVVLTAIDI